MVQSLQAQKMVWYWNKDCVSGHFSAEESDPTSQSGSAPGAYSTGSSGGVELLHENLSM